MTEMYWRTAVLPVLAIAAAVSAGATEAGLDKVELKTFNETFDIHSLTEILSLNKTDFTPFIVGGTNAAVGEYPWMVLVLGFDTEQNIILSCGGVLIRTTWALSARHCVLDDDGRIQGAAFGGVFGVTNLNNLDTESFMFEGSTFVPEFKFFSAFALVASADVDLVMLELSSPSALPSLDIPAFESAEQYGVLTGWGVDRQGESSAELQVLDDVPLLSDDFCGIYAPTYDLSVYRCAGYFSENKGACFGDSGGPLIVPNAEAKHGYNLVGTVVAGVNPCGLSMIPDLYADLIPLKSSIEAFVGPPTTLPPNDQATPAPTLEPPESGMKPTLEPTAERPSISALEPTAAAVYVPTSNPVFAVEPKPTQSPNFGYPTAKAAPVCTCFCTCAETQGYTFTYAHDTGNCS